MDIRGRTSTSPGPRIRRPIWLRFPKDRQEFRRVPSSNSFAGEFADRHHGCNAHLDPPRPRGRGAFVRASNSRASEVPIPVKPKTDSGPDTLKIKTDTIKAPIGRFADPALYEIGPQYEWNRTQLFATGALTLVDLLDRIPGVTTFRSGWLSTPQTATYGGDFRRVRIFYDGLEIDNLDGR